MKKRNRYFSAALVLALGMMLFGCHKSNKKIGECGNGILEPGAGEQCEAGSLGELSCDTFGYFEGELGCYPPGHRLECRLDISGCYFECGNGVAEAFEQCDDGADGDPCDGCLDDCTWHENSCGDGYRCGLEECDDENRVSGDGCSEICVLEIETEEMIEVPPGSFVMGDDSIFTTLGHAQHEVTQTHSFRLGRQEVTNAEYRDALQWAYEHDLVYTTMVGVFDILSCDEVLDLDDEACQIVFGIEGFPEGEAGFSVKEGMEDYPVIEVSWYGAVSYCDWRTQMLGLEPLYDHTDWSCTFYGKKGFRLPTEAEWEYAARYGDGRKYPWGNQQPTCGLVNFFSPGGGYCAVANGTSHADKVGQLPLGNSSLGFSDMAGNVCEWTFDWADDYPTDPQTDPTGPPSDIRLLHRIYRGGSWNSTSRDLQSAFRTYTAPDYTHNNIGFRILRTY